MDNYNTNCDGCKKKDFIEDETHYCCPLGVKEHI